MHPIVKIIIGAIMMVGSVAAVVYSTGTNIEILGVSIPNLWIAFKTVLAGTIPALVFLIGLFIVWLELDELRIERELKAETKKSRKR